MDRFPSLPQQCTGGKLVKIGWVNPEHVLPNSISKCFLIWNIRLSTCSLCFPLKVSAGVRTVARSSVFSARLSGLSSATSQCGVTSCIGYFHVSNVQCSSLEITHSWDTSIFCDDGPPPIFLPFIFLLLLNPLFPTFPVHFSLTTQSLRDWESLAGNECRQCVISVSVCGANPTGNDTVDIFLAAPCPRFRERWGNFGLFWLRSEGDVVIGSPRRLASVRAKCAQFAAASSFHIDTYTMYNRCASPSLSSGRMKQLWFSPCSESSGGEWKPCFMISWLCCKSYHQESLSAKIYIRISAC